MPYFAFDDIRLWYEDTGGAGAPVVLVHGAAGSSENWWQQVPALSGAGYRVVTFDLRNAGRSEAPGELSGQGSVAGDLEQLVRGLGLAPCALVAQAAGGFGALEFALDNPAALRGLVVANSFGGVTDPEYLAERDRLMGPDVNGWPRIERELGRSYRAANPAGVRRFEEMEARGRADFAGRQKQRSPMTLQRLESLQVPTLMIGSDEDVLSPPPLMRMMAERIAACRFEEIAGAGHCAYWEQPGTWNRLVLEFLASLP